MMVYTNIGGLDKKIEAIKRGEHFIIVCVNMLGEGFDLPNLKIAAIHDERQSLPITLQFIGRFTRTSYSELGNASFITNIAYPPIHEELDELYARNADWNLILPRLNENATQKEIDFRNFLNPMLIRLMPGAGGTATFCFTPAPEFDLDPGLTKLIYGPPRKTADTLNRRDEN